MNLRLAFTAALFIVPFASSAQEPDSDAHNKNRVMVITGTGEVSGVPDTAEINVGIVSEAATAESAVQTNNEQMKSLLDAVKRMKIAEKDIQTSSFNISPRYDHRGRQDGESPKINGYRVSNQVHVRVREIESLGSVLDKIVAAGSNQVNGISFSINNSQTLMDEARNAAIRDAKRKAELMAKAANVPLGSIVQIRELSTVDRPFPQRMMAMAEARSAVPIQTGEQTLTAQVQLSFSIAP